MYDNAHMELADRNKACVDQSQVPVAFFAYGAQSGRPSIYSRTWTLFESLKVVLYGL